MMREDKYSIKKGANTIVLIGALVITFIITACICVIGTEMKGAKAEPVVKMTADEKLLAETPLNDYLLFEASEEYTKFQIEAAHMVEKLEAEGKTTEEACEEALLWMSDAVYNDYQEFRSNYPNVIEDIDAYHNDYEEYLNKTQG